MTHQEQEQLIIDFVHGGCVDHLGEPIDIDCVKIWENYQDALHQPGCRGCIKRKTVKRYFNLVKKILAAAQTHPGKKLDIEIT